MAVDPTKLSRNELEAVSRRYMQEMIPFVGPHTDIMGPDMGTNEQIMAWFMDTYSVYQGYAVNEIVTGKPVSIGGTEGRREATGRGVRLSDRTRHGHDEDGSGQDAPRSCRASATSVRSRRLSLALKTGVKIVGISDATTAAIYNPKGIDVQGRRTACDEKGKPARVRSGRPR